MAKTLFIDGPWRGRMQDIGGTAVGYEKMPEIDLTAGWSSDQELPEPQTGVYYVHRFALFGRVVRIASVKVMPDPEAANDLFWDLLASDQAKEVLEYRVPLSEPVHPA